MQQPEWTPENYAEWKKRKYQKFTHCLIPFIRRTRNDEIIEMEERLVKARGQEGWEEGYKRSLWGTLVDGNSLYFDWINTNICLLRAELYPPMPIHILKS